MSKTSSKSLLPTITCAIGILVGGVIGAAIGSFSNSETFVIACYVIGFLGGAVAGSWLGLRTVSRRNSAEPISK